ncbi:MAG: GNAT family N-acetyltransferase [Deltaproteobacteria bacterium]|jgi:ribosomal protein S18 acetylase RimI-like enzyme|nr:GNAT family N-acetyltransferase [Deltaproteobacteria bacterium]
MTYRYGPAGKKDCAVLAELINLASDGVVEYLFRDLVPGVTPVQLIAHNLANADTSHSYKNAIVARGGDDVVGMTLSYSSDFHYISDEMRDFFPPDRLAHLSDFYAARIESSWYLDTLGVFADHRRQGIGEKLISLTKDKAVENGYNSLSLIVFADNKLALPVYKRTGFEIVRKVELGANKFIHHNDGGLLLNCKLAG